MLRATLRELLEDPEMEGEAFQEVMVRLLSSPTEPEDLPSFADRSRRVAMDVARRVALSAADTPLEQESLEQEAQDPWIDPEGAVDTREELELLLHNLGDDAKELLVRRYVLGENASELAFARSQSPAALRVRLMRLRSSARSAR
jgi:DNA-directed RNA polymerase specialized sigma24 family protein